MKIIFIFVSLVLTSTAHAGTVLKCQSLVPLGPAILEILPGQNQTTKILIKWHKDVPSEDFVGSFDVHVDTQKKYLLGDGILGGSIASIRGGTEPNQSGITLLSIYSSDRRIEFGFGLHLACRSL